MLNFAMHLTQHTAHVWHACRCSSGAMEPYATVFSPGEPDPNSGVGFWMSGMQQKLEPTTVCCYK